MEFIIIPALVGIGAFLVSSLRVMREYERAVVFRLGRLTGTRGPGLIVLLPFGLERMIKVPLRIVTMDIPPQDVITRDNVSVKVNAVVYFRVIDPIKATNVIQDYLFATSQLAQTTLRSVVGQAEMDQLLSERDHFNAEIRKILDEGTDPWGVEVSTVEIKDVDLPQEMRRAMAKQAEAERERRAKVIAAEGELQASEKLGMAAEVLQRNPAAIQLRYLQTVAEIATENNSTTLFPIPIELFGGMMQKFAGAGGSAFGMPGGAPAQGALHAGAPQASPQQAVPMLDSGVPFLPQIKPHGDKVAAEKLHSEQPHDAGSMSAEAPAERQRDESGR